MGLDWNLILFERECYSRWPLSFTMHVLCTKGF